MGCDQFLLRKSHILQWVLQVVTMVTNQRTVLLGECIRETNISILFEEEDQENPIIMTSFYLNKCLALKIDSSSTHLSWGLYFRNCRRCQDWIISSISKGHLWIFLSHFLGKCLEPVRKWHFLLTSYWLKPCRLLLFVIMSVIVVTFVFSKNGYYSLGLGVFLSH